MGKEPGPFRYHQSHRGCIMKSALLTAAGVIAIALALSSAHLLGPDDIQAEKDVYGAVAELGAQQRIEK